MRTEQERFAADMAAVIAVMKERNINFTAKPFTLESGHIIYSPVVPVRMGQG